MDSEGSEVRRRLSALQLNDYREVQRVRKPPAELITAALLLHTLLEGSGGDKGNGEGAVGEGAVGEGGSQSTEDDGAVAVGWLQHALPDLTGTFGEHAQRGVEPFLQRLHGLSYH